MKFLATLLVLSFAALVAFGEEALDRDEEMKWVQFKNEQGKDYHRVEEAVRKVQFVKMDRKIKAHNDGNHGWTMAHNHLSDKTEEEKSKLLGAVAPPAGERSYEEFESDRDLMELMMSERQSSVDNRLNRCNGPVKNQKSCGSCWAFCAISALEFSHCKKRNGTYSSLSEQQIVDCDKNNGGCNGGWPYSAWSYVSTAPGSQATASYGYTAKGGTCKFAKAKTVAKVASRGYVPSKNVAAMEAAVVKYGNLAVAIYVQSSFYNYFSGVYADATCPTNGNVNHAVNVIGYGTDSAGVPYWIVRNSWGATWGNRGYILMKKGVNMCGIEQYAHYVEAA